MGEQYLIEKKNKTLGRTVLISFFGVFGWLMVCGLLMSINETFIMLLFFAGVLFFGYYFIKEIYLSIKGKKVISWTPEQLTIYSIFTNKAKYSIPWDNIESISYAYEQGVIFINDDKIYEELGIKTSKLNQKFQAQNGVYFNYQAIKGYQEKEVILYLRSLLQEYAPKDCADENTSENKESIEQNRESNMEETKQTQGGKIRGFIVAAALLALVMFVLLWIISLFSVGIRESRVVEIINFILEAIIAMGLILVVFESYSTKGKLTNEQKLKEKELEK
ncbi:hypothetical protein JZO78_08445 [Enterococcus ureilyticus]|uniref:STM3941 family protein n=1 Tax=Enterococcus ureilyticus TaxID=1131292 RepID=UPI001A932F1B|nr:STM3941 family protein [Enterococcus ureilyticus]MBO0446371.1 hypothetical protein [Enterococcus ureilyticus]